ncbi:MAG: hypothetical protein IJH87_04625, partial [Atopobiaceae bacterium]|nr:hypothetical protein [Atopobiaceae bacterium]
MESLPKLSYREEDRFVPIPPHEQALQTVVAEHFVDIPMEGFTAGHNLLEGLIFDRAGNLFLTPPEGNRILKVDMATKEVSVFAQLPDSMTAAAVKIHKDGNLYLAIAYSTRGSMVAVLSPEGELVETFLEGS